MSRPLPNLPSQTREGLCLFCASPKYRPSFLPPTQFNEKVFEYRECLDCHLHFLFPNLTEDDLKKLYASSYHDAFYFKKEAPSARNLKLLQRMGIAETILDFGCGDGGFIKECERLGFKCTGVEFDPELVTRLKRENSQSAYWVANDFYEQNEETYDLIHLGDVLEHMSNPREFLLKIKKYLKPHGSLMVHGPLENNSNWAFFLRKTVFSLKKKLWGKRFADHAPFHTFFASRKNQLHFFEMMGFRTSYVEIYEEAWPFVEKWSEVKTPGQFLKYVIARFSIAFSKLLPHWGNRLSYLGQLHG